MPEVATPKKSAGWTTVAFGDVVQLSKERSSDPEADGYERYIGLEHIDPGELRVRRWGDIADGVTFTNVFKPGQVLFGKRRAYQRKVAVADFSGVCSGDIYALEPKGDGLLPELLPFICQTDAFFEHAVGTSAGSLSPRTNWKSLATFEFVLPPIEEQRRITAALAAAERCTSQLRNCEESLHTVRRANINSAFSPVGGDPSFVEVQALNLPSGYELIEASDLSIAPITKGDTPRGEYRSEDGDVPFIKIYNLNFDGQLDFTIDPTFISRQAHCEKLKRSQVRPGDILMNLVGPPLGKIGLVTNEYPDWNINQAIARYRPPDPLVRRYLWYYLQSDWAQLWLLRRSKKTSGQRNLTLKLAQELPVPLPRDEAILASITHRLDSLNEMRVGLRSRLEGSRRIQRSLSTLFREGVR